MRCGVYLLTVSFFYESRVRCGRWRRGQTAQGGKKMLFVSISGSQNKLSPLVMGAPAEDLHKYR